MVNSDLCVATGVLFLEAESLLEPDVHWWEYYDLSWHNVSTITATCGRE